MSRLTILIASSSSAMKELWVYFSRNACNFVLFIDIESMEIYTCQNFNFAADQNLIDSSHENLNIAAYTVKKSL